MSKKISIVEKRTWLDEYERGKSEAAIASSHKRDTRTVKKALDDARRERDAKFARAELMKEALHSHQDTLKEELNRIMKTLEPPRNDFAPLSWYEGVGSIFTSVGRTDNLGYVAKVALEAGRPPATSITPTDLVRQHLKNDKLWKSLVQWEKAYMSHIAERVAMQKKLVSLLQQKTGYKLVAKSNIPPPFICSYTSGPVMYEAILTSALGEQTKPGLEDDIVADEREGVVKYHNSILAEAPGNVEECRAGILTAYNELLKSLEFEKVRGSYWSLDESAAKARQAAEEIVLLGYIPGQCRVCKRLGM